MPISRPTAQRLMASIIACGNSLCGTLEALEAELSPDEFKKMKREVGRVIATMDAGLGAFVAYEHPDLAPEAVPIARPILSALPSRDR